MLVTKEISLKNVILWSGPGYLFLCVYIGIIAALYQFNIIQISIPWLPISVIGTAVAFFVGFKNNQAYDRMWEARKIWGGIVNDSRSWGMLVDGYITDQFTDERITEEELKAIKKRLMYRHIGWLYAHRSQLLVSAPWEHSSQSGHVGRKAKFYQKTFGLGLIDDDITRRELRQFLVPEEHDRLIGHANTATQNYQRKFQGFNQIAQTGYY